MRFLLLALACLPLAAACGGDGSASPTPDFSASARDAVQSGTLTLEDLPAGFSEASGNDIGSLVDLSPQCNVFDLGVTFPGAAATAESPAYDDGGQRNVQSFAAVYTDEDDAQSVLEGTSDIFQRCGDEYRDEVKRLADEQLQALGIDLGIFGSIDVSLDTVDTPTLGDGSATYRVQVTVSLPGTDQHYTLDVWAIREGRAVGAVTYATYGLPDAAQEGAIADAQRAALAEAEAALPAGD